MARRGIEYIDVNTAILELLSKGITPTIDGIREQLGTGSKTTIARLFKEWKAHNAMEQSYNSWNIPPQILVLIAELYTAMEKEAKLESLKLKRELDLFKKQNQDLKSKLTEARKLIRDLKRQIK